MGEGVGGGTVKGHLGADAHTDDHVADLAYDMIGQKAPGIVLQHRVDDAVKGHERAQPHQDLGTRIGPDQHVDRGLGGEGAQENGTGDRGLGIGVGEPGVEGRHRCVEDEGHQDHRVGEPPLTQRAEQKGPRLHAVEDDPAEQQDAARDMDHEVAERSTHGRRLLRREDQISGGEGHDLPGHQEGKPIAGEDHAESAAHVQERGHMLLGPPDVQRVNRADQRHDGEDPGEHQAELVDLAEQERRTGEIEGAVVSGRQGRHVGDGEQRNQDQPSLAQASAEPRDQQGADDEQQPGMNPVSHSSPRAA